MAPRPYDADEPGRDRDEADPGVPDDARADGRKKHADHPDRPAPDPDGDAPDPDRPAPDPDRPAPNPDGEAPAPAAIDPDEVDARWRQIVAELGDLAAPPDGTRPLRRAGDRVPQDRPAAPRPEGDPAPPGPTGPRTWAPDPDVEEAENHFVPPDPGPVLGGDPLLTMAWVVAVGAPVAVVLSVILWREDVPSLALQVAGLAFLVAVGLLLWRMPHDHDDEDRSGPGAVV